MNEPTKISDLLRTTIDNATDFLMKIAAHIDAIESENAALKAKVEELENGTTEDV